MEMMIGRHRHTAQLLKDDGDHRCRTYPTFVMTSNSVPAGTESVLGLVNSETAEITRRRKS